MTEDFFLKGYSSSKNKWSLESRAKYKYRRLTGQDSTFLPISASETR